MPDKKTIAFLCHPYHRGGVTRWMADAAIAFAKKGHVVYFITVTPTKAFFSAKGRETLVQLLGKEKNSVCVITAPAGYEFEFGTPEYKQYVYRQLIVQLPINTPIILSDDHAVWAAAASLSESYPVIGVLHSDEAQYYRHAEQYADKVDVLACVSSRVRNRTMERVPAYDKEHIFTIPCGIEIPPANDTIIAAPVLQLAYVGRVSNYQKRASDLAEICKQLVRKNLPFHLSIIGDGDAKAPLEDKMIAYGLQEQVTFYGWLAQSKVAALLSETDILLLTSDFEGTPIAMMEAFAAGCGVVGTRVSGIEDYENHPLAGDCLRVFATGNIAEAAAQINIIAAIPAATRWQAARRIAETEFSMDVCLTRYLNAMSTIKPRTAMPGTVTMSIGSKLYSSAIAWARKTKMTLAAKK